MVRVSASGRITLPEEIREELGLRTGVEIVFEETDDGYVVRKVVDEDRFERWRGVAETDETVGTVCDDFADFDRAPRSSDRR